MWTSGGNDRMKRAAELAAGLRDNGIVLATLTATYSHGDGSFPTEMARRLVEQDLEHARVYLEALEVALAPLIGGGAVLKPLEETVVGAGA
jgi:hypothetical protein